MERFERAMELMESFAERTGVSGGIGGPRYLWTDAFAVCNFLGAARVTHDDKYLELALGLVDRVHHTLGQHRPDDEKRGWLGRKGGEASEEHPTVGGLRIGKPLPERTPSEPRDERIEWDRDGQYFHYLTKWMHALHRAAKATGRSELDDWARTLALTAHEAFVYAPDWGGPKRMFWKMSVDLDRPLVASMGHHDPLDGYLTCLELDVTAPVAKLIGPAEDFSSMIDIEGLATDDPLGLGGLLVDAYRVLQLSRATVFPDAPKLFAALLDASRVGLALYLERSDLRLPAHRRLAFREIGLAIGLEAIARMLEDARRDSDRFLGGPRERRLLEELGAHVPLGAEIEAFWLRPENRRTAVFRDHADINEVMLATSLSPDGFLVLDPPAS